MFRAQKIWLYTSIAAMLWGLIYLTPRLSQANPANQNQAAISYDNQRICASTSQKTLDFRNSQENSFVITLQEGCFGELIHVPEWWNAWHTNANGYEPNFWYAIWFPSDVRGIGPLFANDNRTFHKNAHEPFRAQGHGSLYFYTDQQSRVPPAKTETTQPEEPITVVDARGSYVQETFCTSQDSPEGELHYETLDIDHFVIKMQEGCWSPYIYPPNKWNSGFHNIRLTAASIGREPDWWIAIWPLGKVPAGPFTRDDSGSSKYRLVIPNESKPFRVQGKGEVWIGKPDPF